MSRVLTFLIRCYQTLLSPLLGNRCRFYPTCSQYAVEAIDAHGIARGGQLSVKRLCKCHPWHEGGIDLVPPCDQTNPGKHAH